MPAAPSVTRDLVQRLHELPSDSGLAILFPGQGSQQVGMGADICEASALARSVFQQAETVLGMHLARLCFQGPEQELRQTANAQPAIMVTSLACLAAALESGLIDRRPAFLAGHSLGEYTALVAAGALPFEEGLTLVRRRGLLMEDAGQRKPGTMAAILGLDEDAAAELCRLAGAEPCNYNAPTQVVVGGPPQAVAAALTLARERGARALPLAVSGAFHTSLMAEAAADFASLVEGVSLSDPAIPVVANADGRIMTTAEDVRAELNRQMVSPVLWRQSVSAMAQAGAATFLEVGPGRVLTGLVGRTVPGVAARSLDGAAPRSGHV